MTLLTIKEEKLAKIGPMDEYMVSAHYYVLGKEDLTWHLHGSGRKVQISPELKDKTNQYLEFARHSVKTHVMEVLTSGKVTIWFVDESHEDGGYDKEIDIISIVPIPDDFKPREAYDNMQVRLMQIPAPPTMTSNPDNGCFNQKKS